MTQANVAASTEQFLSFSLAGQLFGVPILQVNDVLGPHRITQAPLAPPAVAGVMNLRGRIVTAIDVRKCLGQPARGAEESHMGVVIDRGGELFSLMIDKVGDVLSLSDDTYEAVPPTLDATWRGVSSGIHKLAGGILLVLDVPQLLKIAGNR